MKLKVAKNERPKNMEDGRLQIQLALTGELLAFHSSLKPHLKFHV